MTSIERCSSKNRMHVNDFLRMGNLFGADERSAQDLWCELEKGHDDRHVHGVIHQDIGPDHEIHWWASWLQEMGPYALFTAPQCGFTEGNYDCYLILGHPKDHDLD